MRLFPRRYERPLFDLFADLAHLLEGGSEILSRTLGESPRERPRIAGGLQERGSDALTLSRRITNRLAAALITPFEAEVLHAIATEMTATVREMERTADLVVRFEMGSLPDELLETAELIARASEITVEASWYLGDEKHLHEYSDAVHRLANHGERLVRGALADLYRSSRTVGEMMQHREIAMGLRQVLAHVEGIARGTDLLRIKDA